VSIKRRAAEAFTRPVPRTAEQIVRDRRQGAQGVQNPNRSNAPRPRDTTARVAEPQYVRPPLEAQPRLAQRSETLEATTSQSSDSPQPMLNNTISVTSTAHRRLVRQSEMPGLSAQQFQSQSSLNLNQSASNPPTAQSTAHSVEVQRSDSLGDTPSQYMESMHKLLQSSTPSSHADPASDIEKAELDRLMNFFTPSELPGFRHVDDTPSTYEAGPSTQNVSVSQGIAMLEQKRVRIALNPSNGLPRENVGRFYRESIIGEWAASSPRTGDQMHSTNSDLDTTLAILAQDADTSMPLTTPLNKRLVAYPTSIAPGETPSFPLAPNRIFTPPDVVDNPSPTLESPNSPYDMPSPCRRIMGRFAEAIEEAEITSLPRYLEVGVSNQGTADQGHDSQITKDATAEIPNATSRKPGPQGDENLSDIFLELAMSEGMTNKIRLQRQAREAKAKAKAKAEKKAAEEAAAAKRAQAEAEEAERQRQSWRRMPREKLVQSLNAEWETRISEAMHKGDNAPLATTASGTELTRKDFMTVLGAQRWLNDEIINAYIEWIVEYANEKSGKSGRNAIPKVIAHNSFFYQNLSTKGPDSVSRWMKRKKAEGKKLLDVECVLIPVNNSSHWTLIVVSPKKRTVEYLDSFGGDPMEFVSNTLAWLKNELAENWREEEWRVLETKSAQQTNSYDCGVFAVTNAECVVGGITTQAYSRHDMTEQRRRIAAVLLNRGFGGVLTPAEDL
jgi:Ulp1 protease family, C-terminal catalytic domain